jgi:ketosteroid isomerase-like protein
MKMLSVNADIFGFHLIQGETLTALLPAFLALALIFDVSDGGATSGYYDEQMNQTVGNMPRNLFCTLLLVTGLAACSGGTDSVADPVQAREALLEADRAFAQRAIESGIEAAYDEFLSEDAVQLPDGGAPLAGKAAIMANVADAAAAADFELSWAPAQAQVSASGDLGYTWGRYFLEGVDAEGQPYADEGKYANVWARDAGGDWRVVLDISNQNELLMIGAFGSEDYLNEDAPSE